jgi:kelch-like protein 10
VTGMNVQRSAHSAVVIIGLPNLDDYIYKHRDRLKEEERQNILALASRRSQENEQ